MKKEQSVYNKLHKFGETQEPIKVELFSVDEAGQAATYLEEAADELMKLKKELARDMRRVESMVIDGTDQYRSLLSAKQDIERMAKQLGVNPSTIVQYKAAEKALTNWEAAKSMKI